MRCSARERESRRRSSASPRMYSPTRPPRSPACRRCSPRCCSRGPANNPFPGKESAHGIVRQGRSHASVAGAHHRIVLPRRLRVLGRREPVDGRAQPRPPARPSRGPRSEEHTSELQSPFLISYAVFCLKKKKKTQPSQVHCVLFFVSLFLSSLSFFFFFFNDTATTEIYTRKDTLSLHDALPIAPTGTPEPRP